MAPNRALRLSQRLAQVPAVIEIRFGFLESKQVFFLEHSGIKLSPCELRL